MADDPIKQAAEGKRIQVEQSDEVRRWTETLGISEERLKDIVGKVGPMAEDVLRELGKERTAGDPGPRDFRKAESGRERVD
jgi:hypothetical protein